jgi:clan AA aspartic protease
MTMREIFPATKIVPARNHNEDVVGLTHVTVTVCNPADISRKWQGLFLVDTGAIDCMLPGKSLREIGIVPVSQRTFELADGSKVELDVAVGQVEFMGDIVGATVVFGPDDCEPILGVTALESTGVIVDPKTKQLRRLPAVPLK